MNIIWECFRYEDNMPTIVYLDTLPAKNGLDILHSQSKVEILKINSSDNEEKCMSILQKADAYQVGAARDEVPKYLQVDKQFLNKVPNLIVVSSSGAGYDTIDVEACTDAGVLVVNQTGGNAEGVAEHAVGMILNLFKRIGECDHALRRGWNEPRVSLMGKDLLNKNVGIIGLGNTGGRVAEICKVAFNCNILAYDPYLSDEAFKKKNANKTDTKNEKNRKFNIQSRKNVDDFWLRFCDPSGAKVRKSCRSRRKLSNEYLLAKIGVDTAKNEPHKVWRKIQFIIHSPPYANRLS